jgi:hypothetical protein
MSHPLQPIVEDLLREIHRQDRALQRAINRGDDAWATMLAKKEGLQQALSIVLKHRNR